MGGVNKLDDLAARLAGEANPSVIRAYHGSPHDFDKFDASKIDTGEGAQAYGHGLYFAGNEDVARSYRDITPSLLPPEAAELKQQISQLFKQQSDLTGELQMAADTDGFFDVGWGNFKAPPEVARARIMPQLANVSKQLADVQKRMHNVLAGRRGHMYEVEIAHPEHVLLDWDAPISRQPKVIQKAFGEYAMDQPGDGGRIYRDITTRRGEEFDDDMTGLLAGRAAANELLQEGIPGIRYLDGGSRRAGDGTRNYVVFPGAEDQIRILRKYAVPGAVGTGVASQYEESP
jgi:hypothetical protein